MKIMSALTSTEVTPPSERMLRLDPGEGRIRTARNFQVLEGGGEYNTSRGLCKGFGYDCTWACRPARRHRSDDRLAVDR